MLIGVEFVYCCKDSEYFVFEIDEKNVTKEIKEYNGDYFFDDRVCDRKFLRELSCHTLEDEYNKCDYRKVEVVC
jgi:hypothetical protein